MKLTLPDKISSSLISAEALYAAEKAGPQVYMHTTFTKTTPRRLWNQQALIGPDYIELMTGKAYKAVRNWIERGKLHAAQKPGPASYLFDVGFIEHLLQREAFAANEDALHDEARVARLFWLWPPRHGLEIEDGSPMARLFAQQAVRDGSFEKFVNETLAEVAKLRLADQAEPTRQAG